MTYLPHIKVLYSPGVVALDPCSALGTRLIARMALPPGPAPMRDIQTTSISTRSGHC